MAAKWARDTNIVWEVLNAEALLVSSETGERVLLNSAATYIWKMCDGAHDLADLAAAFALATGRTLKRAKEEMEEFCSRLFSLGFLMPQATTALASLLPNCVFAMSGLEMTPGFRILNIGASGPRRRPSPRGNSGPG